MGQGKTNTTNHSDIGEIRAGNFSFKGYAVLTFLIVDFFSHVLTGMIIIVFFQSKYDLISILDLSELFWSGGAAESIIVFFFVMGFAYIAGRLAEIIGSLVSSVFPPVRYHNLFQKVYKDLILRRNDEFGEKFSIEGIRVISREVNQKRIGIFGIAYIMDTIKFWLFPRYKSDAFFVLGNLGHRWLYTNRPDLYFLEIGRFKASGSIVEMMFGIYCIVIPFLPNYLSYSLFNPLVALSVIIIFIFSFATIYRFRLLQIEHAVGAILTIWLIKQEHKDG